MDINNYQNAHIIFPDSCQQTIFDHCYRKLSGNYLACETNECKAFGIIAGTKVENTIRVERCFPLMKNVRLQEPYKKYLDKVMEEYAIPSETPLSRRGWVADPEELTEVINECQSNYLTMLGSYHMHRVPWEHDRLRETPTTLDAILGEKSRMIMFIVAMVNPEQPVIRAFYEGVLAQELPVYPTIPEHSHAGVSYNYNYN